MSTEADCNRLWFLVRLKSTWGSPSSSWKSVRLR